jgi:hypothetical protein
MQRVRWLRCSLTREYHWALVASALILLFGSFPIFAGYAAQTPGERFIGTYFDWSDYAVHMAMMHYGGQGAWGYQMRFSTEAVSTVYIRMFYIALGHVGAWIHMPADVLYQVSRVLFGLLACLAIYRLLNRIFPDIAQRRLAFILAMLGAGMGWLQVIFDLVPQGRYPVDLWFIDPYPLFGINLFPHFAAVIAALAFAITAFLDHLVKPNLQNIIVIVISALIVQVVNPIAFILADITMAGLFVFHSWKKGRLDGRLALTLGIIAAAQIPLLYYSFVLLTRDPAWALFTRQNALPSPPLWDYLLGFGIFWPFAVAGVVRAFRQRLPHQGGMATWIVGAFMLAYLPVAIQRRFLLAVTIPLAVLATQPIMDSSRWFGSRLKVNLKTGAVVLASLASLTTLMMTGMYSLGMSARPPNLFEPAALVEAVDWLGRNSSPADFVLASEPVSLLVAIRTPLGVYSGHPMETLNYVDKKREVQSFYQGKQPEGWLAAQMITWVIYGPEEEEWNANPPEAAGLEIAYRNDQVSIYRFILP